MRRAGNVIAPVVAQGAKAFDPRPGIAQEFEAFARPAATVRNAAVDEGLANITTGRDSVVRSLPLLLRARGEELPAWRSRSWRASPGGRSSSTRPPNPAWSMRPGGRSRSGSTTRC